MPSLKQQLRQDLTTAMREQDVTTRDTLRMVLAGVSNEEVSGSEARELSDAEVVRVLAKEAKRRRESAAAYDDAGREELAAAERAELLVIERYLPQQLTDTELQAVVAGAVASADKVGPAAMGSVMKAATAAAAGQADGKRLAAEVRRQLGIG
jgi:uncharacterized protein YqeY